MHQIGRHLLSEGVKTLVLGQLPEAKSIQFSRTDSSWDPSQGELLVTIDDKQARVTGLVQLPRAPWGDMVYYTWTNCSYEEGLESLLCEPREVADIVRPFIDQRNALLAEG